MSYSFVSTLEMVLMQTPGTSPANYALPQLSAAVNLPALTLSYGTNFFGVSRSLRSERFAFISLRKCSKLSACEVESEREFPMQTGLGVWEDPDEGSGSDYDDEDDEELEEKDMDYESDWEQQMDASPSAMTIQKSTLASREEEDLVEEVEGLLTPEERVILQQNPGPNLEKISTAKWKPLQTLALSGQIRLMDKLLVNGLDIDSVDKDGLTALHKAIIGKKEAVISHLLRKGASPYVKDRDGASLLHYAVQAGAIQTVKLLIKYKVDVNVADNEGWTPLHIAVQSRNRDIVKVLLVNGADKTRRTMHGNTPLDLCLCYGKDFNSYDLAKLVKTVPVDRGI
ncbi:hypothetical protein K2173_019998 [Erythroxylum novogranatense]|uniref:Ankyrin repeat domain-containing protein EMB506, chloroplastic n=1 Tax=Erythroxylum novogranatense TaxID=1862640 RepID=A0AAV8UA22_9ROSI|nr:hypothetical protein K2173_019998 [Erythroxylum novogranatense]